MADTLREAEPGENHRGLIGSKVDRFVIVESSAQAAWETCFSRGIPSSIGRSP